MADKEKLIEAVGSFKFPIESCGCTIGEYIVPYSVQEPFVDHLIAYGVVIAKMETTTKWIPVTDENPKEAGEYIVKIAYASAATALWYNPVEDVWFSDDYRDTYPVTHWMYMPEPPKGE